MKRTLSFRLKNIIILFFSIIFITNVSAQEIGDNSYNYNSLRPIRKGDIMYMKTVWTRIDLRQKINEPFFAKNLEIIRTIINAVKAGVLRPYTSDSLVSRMSLKQFSENLKVPGADIIDDGVGDLSLDSDFGGEFEGADDSDFDDFGIEGESEIEEVIEFLPSQIYTFQIKNDIIFDKKRSRIYNDLQSIELIIPADENPLGIDKTIAVFSFKELVENVFIDNPNALWVNTKNDNAHLNLLDAFDLALQYGHITKYSNPRDDLIEDIYSDPKLVLVKSLEYEYGLVDYESVLWEQ